MKPYDGSAEARREHAELLAKLPGGGTVAGLPGPAPTAAQLARHAERFGPDQVTETAAELGLEVDVKKPARKRAKGPTLKARVAELVAEGHTVETIAETLDLTPSRARRLVAEVRRAA